MSENLFDAAYGRFLSAKAAVAVLDALGQTEGAMEAALAKAADAEWELIRTPSKCLANIRRRAITVREIFDDAAAMGAPTDNRHYAALAVLVSEILGEVIMDESQDREPRQ